MLKAVLGYITTVMAVMLDAALGVVGRPRRLAWVEVALFFVGRREPVLGALSEAEGQSAVARGISRPWGLWARLGRLRRRSRAFATVGAVHLTSSGQTRVPGRGSDGRLVRESW